MSVCLQNSAAVANDVQRVYSSFEQLTIEYQEHSGAVNTSTSVNVQYQYANGSANTIRPTAIVYPNGRVLNLTYGASGGMDDALSRIASLIDNDAVTHLADYTRLGLASIVQVSSPQPQIAWSLINGTGADPYSGLDQFNRVVDNRWFSTATDADLDRIQHGYDLASNRIWRKNTVAEAAGVYLDELYAYDGLYRLADLQRGQLNSTNTSIVPGTQSLTQEWILDPTGNWIEFQRSDSSGTLEQFRSANTVNEITGISTPWVTPSYDAAGNMTSMPQPANPSIADGGVYDAWNRLTSVSSGGSSLVANVYDGLNRRAVKTTAGAIRHFYYSAAWQVLEERLGTDTSPDRQFVWGLGYIDDLVLRDSGDYSPTRFYALQDPSWNVTAVCDYSTGSIEERYDYAAYGQPTFLNATFAVLAASQFDWETLFAGYRWESEIALYSVRNRYLNAIVGVLLQRDALGIARASNRYEYVASRPTTAIDPFGLQVIFFEAAPRFWPQLAPIESPLPRIYVPPPEPVFTPRQAPFLVRPTAPGGEPEPVGPNPSQIPADKPMKKPWKCPTTRSDCTAKQLASLNNSVNSVCPGHNIVDFSECSAIYSALWSCNAIEDLANKWTACCNARRKRENTCFRGGNYGHRVFLDQCNYQASYCYYLLRYYQWPGYRPFRGPLPQQMIA